MGATVKLGVRPEDLVETSGEPLFTGEVEITEALGEVTLLYFKRQGDAAQVIAETAGHPCRSAAQGGEAGRRSEKDPPLHERHLAEVPLRTALASASRPRKPSASASATSVGTQNVSRGAGARSGVMRGLMPLFIPPSPFRRPNGAWTSHGISWTRRHGLRWPTGPGRSAATGLGLWRGRRRPRRGRAPRRDPRQGRPIALAQLARPARAAPDLARPARFAPCAPGSGGRCCGGSPAPPA